MQPVRDWILLSIWSNVCFSSRTLCPFLRIYRGFPQQRQLLLRVFRLKETPCFDVECGQTFLPVWWYAFCSLTVPSRGFIAFFFAFHFDVKACPIKFRSDGFLLTVFFNTREF